MSKKTRDALIRNMKKNGWTVNLSEGTYEDLKILYAENEWVLYKGEQQIGTESYGSNQLRNIKKIAMEHGVVFGKPTKAMLTQFKSQNRETLSNTEIKKTYKDKQTEAIEKANKEAEANKKEEENKKIDLNAASGRSKPTG